MGDIVTTYWYRVTAADGGSTEFPVDARRLNEDINNGLGTERELVAHECWRFLFNISPQNQLTRERNNVSKVLRNLCDSLGVEVVKAKFTKSIRFERIR